MKRFLPQLVLVLLVIALAPVAAAAEHTKDSLATVKKNLKEKKAVLFDVREQREWDAGHLKQAVLVPLSELRDGTDPASIVKGLKKDIIIYCHCRSGGRVLRATDIARKLGYDMRPLKYGYADLLGAGFEKAK
jgi:rhodanese-related sulfurtransferase